MTARMNTLRVLGHEACGGMGHLGTYLEQRNIPYEMIHINRGEEEAAALFGATLPASFEVFEWHEDMFSVPPGGIPLLYGNCIKNQGFLHGQCLALQFHPEITASKIQDCLAHHADDLRNTSARVQEREDMPEGLTHRLDQLHAVADTLFGWWLNMVEENEIGAICPR